MVSAFLGRKLEVLIDAARWGNEQPLRAIVVGTIQGDRHEGGILILSLILEHHRSARLQPRCRSPHPRVRRRRHALEARCAGRVVRPLAEHQEAFPGTVPDPRPAGLRWGPQHSQLSGTRAAAWADPRARADRPGGRATASRVRSMDQGPQALLGLVTAPSIQPRPALLQELGAGKPVAPWCDRPRRRREIKKRRRLREETPPRHERAACDGPRAREDVSVLRGGLDRRLGSAVDHRAALGGCLGARGALRRRSGAGHGLARSLGARGDLRRGLGARQGLGRRTGPRHNHGQGPRQLRAKTVIQTGHRDVLYMLMRLSVDVSIESMSRTIP